MSLLRTSNPHIARLEKNSKGRDLIVGDIHGCLDAFNRLLKKSNFNHKKDRVICTGDLTHRGPDSLACLQLLKEPWFYAVRGNHEENTIDALNLHFGMPTTKADAFYQLAIDGGLWLCELVAKSFTKSPQAPLVSQALSDALFNIQNMPKIIIVGEEKNKYIVVHSGLIKSEKLPPTDEKFSSKCLYSELEIEEISLGLNQLANPKLLNESKIVGNYLKKLDSQKKLDSLDQLNHFENSLSENSQIDCQIYCGHTPLSAPTKFLNHTHLDTGAGKADREHFKRKLTMIDTKSEQLYQTKASFPEPVIEPKDYAKKVEKALAKGESLPNLK
jgi:serine/threonine protein phosphatase 1